MGAPGGAPLYSLSVAWVSYLWSGKRVLRRSLALFCLLPGYKLWFRLTKGYKGPFVIYAPIFVFEGGQCYTRHFVSYIMDPIQIIVNIHVNNARNFCTAEEISEFPLKPCQYGKSYSIFIFDATLPHWFYILHQSFLERFCKMIWHGWSSIE